jgi:Holliday junction resolvase-like predicted endonuclease
MPTPLDSFGKTAQKLARNPLGIIALFIVLIYGFASLVVGVSGKSLEPEQRWPLIWFLVIFPVIVLAVFAWLVSRHHLKLYAPADYRNEELFLHTLPPSLQRIRLQDEVQAIQVEATGHIEQIETTADSRALPPAVNDSNGSEGEQEDEVLSNIMSDYILAEDLALRHIEAETGKIVNRQVAFGANRLDTAFDGAIVQDDKIIVIEVKMLKTTFTSSQALQSVLYRAANAASLLKKSGQYSSFTLLLVFVTQLVPSDHERAKNRIMQKLQDTLVPVDVRFYRFEELKRKYGMLAS